MACDIADCVASDDTKGYAAVPMPMRGIAFDKEPELKHTSGILVSILFLELAVYERSPASPTNAGSSSFYVFIVLLYVLSTEKIFI